MIKVPYTVTADIAKYEGEAFNSNPNPDYLIQKEEELNKFGPGAGYTLIDGYQFVEDLSTYCKLKKTNDIREIALQLEEDIAILYCGRVVSMCFCFPSGFRPMEKVGKTFLELHEPVPDRQKLDRASGKIVEMISKPGSLYRRFVWTLTTTPQLSRHPFYKSSEPPVTTIENLYFRKETQTTVGYGDTRTTFFFVKVETVPFIDLHPEEQRQAVESLLSMSDAVLEYKGLTEIKKLFL